MYHDYPWLRNQPVGIVQRQSSPVQASCWVIKHGWKIHHFHGHLNGKFMGQNGGISGISSIPCVMTTYDHWQIICGLFFSTVVLFIAMFFQQMDGFLVRTNRKWRPGTESPLIQANCEKKNAPKKWRFANRGVIMDQEQLILCLKV